MVPENEAGEMVFKPAVDIDIKGEGIDISRHDLRINPEGETNYRIQEGAKELIDKFNFQTYVYNKKMEFVLHTWLASGKHLDLLTGKEITLGSECCEKVKVDLDGKEVELRICLRYYEA
ncbi:MAG: hypothetical protein K6B65_07305 [Bacilli bacterium]|nr:hypothetical protein [Bacilli bacterium]